MIVAFTKGLENIKNELEEYGIYGVIYGEYSGYVDALVYDELINMETIENSYSALCDNIMTKGILLVNAGGRSAGEIYNILKNKTYTSLF